MAAVLGGEGVCSYRSHVRLPVHCEGGGGGQQAAGSHDSRAVGKQLVGTGAGLDTKHLQRRLRQRL